MKKRLLTAIAVSAMACFATPTTAQTLFTGSTTGCFTTVGGTCTQGSTATTGGLTFTGGTFNQSTDASGFLGIGGLTDNLGTFSLLGTPQSYSGSMFNLLVSFTSPSGTTPSSSLFTALLTGSVISTTSGSVFLNFDNTTRLFGSAAGPFTFAVNDVSVSAGSSGQILSGQVQMAAVPEPGTWALMLLGFGGVGYSMRRRRRSDGILQIA